MATFYSYPNQAIEYAKRNPGHTAVVARDLDARQYLDGRQQSRPEYREHTYVRPIPDLGYGWEWVTRTF